ncbi:MAG: hypothetical protein EOP51_17065 [Sphingobacteriales bacterium]|nr:MAG: hypothetical protein EOP51_17065 [Sphingobacteriales bacterium]
MEGANTGDVKMRICGTYFPSTIKATKRRKKHSASFKCTRGSVETGAADDVCEVGSADDDCDAGAADLDREVTAVEDS